jgi:hypothetical protein
VAVRASRCAAARSARRAAARHRACKVRGARLLLRWRAARRVAVCTFRQALAAAAAAAPGGSAGARFLLPRAEQSTSSSGAPLPTLVVSSSVCAQPFAAHQQPQGAAAAHDWVYFEHLGFPEP